MGQDVVCGIDDQPATPHHGIMTIDSRPNDDPSGEHLLMLAHSLGAGGLAFACLAAIARDWFGLGYSVVWDFGWASAGFIICWSILLHSRYRSKDKGARSTTG
jgi:hypothetical protein